MSKEKVFWWIKLKTDFFSEQTIEFLLSQNNGSKYVVIYMMLMLQTANTDGRLSMTINEVIVPFDLDKVTRDAKFFDIDTVKEAFRLYEALGLIYQDIDNVLRITNQGLGVGSVLEESQERMERRKKNKTLKLESGQMSGQKSDKSIELRDKSIDSKDIEIKDKKTMSVNSTQFIPPTLEEVEAYCIERNNGVNPNNFIDFYESKGWMVGKNKMKDWKASVRTWEPKKEKDKELENIGKVTSL